MKQCEIKNCTNKHYAKGFCSKHYTQMRRYGKIIDRTKYDKNDIILYNNYAEVIIYNKECEEVARMLIDIDDIERVSQYKWFFTGHGYIVNSEHQENTYNKELCSTNTSGVTGVSWDKLRNKWIAHIKRKNLGRFNTKEEAIKVRKQAEIEYFGEFRNKE